MAIAEVVRQLIGDGRLRAAGAVAVEAHAQGDLVHRGKGHAVLLTGEEIGVVLHAGERVRAVGAVELHRQRHRQVIAREELHHAPQPRLRLEGGGDLHRAPRGDALNCLQPLRLLLDHEQRILAELRDEPLGRRLSDALDRAGGEPGDQLLLALRHPARHLLGRELRAIARVVDPHARDRHALAGRGARDAADHRHQLPLVRQERGGRCSRSPHSER